MPGSTWGSGVLCDKNGARRFTPGAAPGEDRIAAVADLLEPGTMGMMIAGFGAAILARRRRA